MIFDTDLDKNSKIAQKWLHAFNEHDLDKLVKLYHKDAKHYSPKLKARQPETNGLIRGKDELRRWWKDAFDRLPTLHYDVNTLTANIDRVFMEYTRKVNGEDDLFVAELLEIKDDLIIASRVYHG